MNQAETKQPPIGIDLGTTYSVVAHLDETGRPFTLVNGLGDLTTPSAVLCDDGELVIGKEALKSSTISPANYAECFKRDMGSLEYHRQVHGIEVPPEVLSALLIERLKLDAERHVGPIKKAVITVPAFFDETRRMATQVAGRLAGLEVLDIINEPTAAAIACARQHRNSSEINEKPARLLVYDLGGGTFDVTILEIEGSEYRTLATDGDVQLGGKDFDQRIVNHVAEAFFMEHGVDPRSDPQDAAQLWLDAQEAKHALTERNKTTLVCYHAGLRLRMEITRDQFEQLTCDLLQRSETTTALVMRQAGLEWSKIDQLLLVGGSSRMPMVRQMIAQLSGVEPEMAASPDEAVAHGAAIYCGMLMNHRGENSSHISRLINVNSHSLGIVGIDKTTREPVTKVLIPKNTPLPCRVVRTFPIARKDQRTVVIAVVEGESHRPSECIALGICQIQDLPAGLPAGTPIEIQYSYAANGRISASARVPSTRHSAHVEINRDHSRDLGDLQTWKLRLQGQPLANASDAQAMANSHQKSNPVAQLDTIYLHIGTEALASNEVPAALLESRESAIRLQEELEVLRGTFNELGSKASPSAGSQEAIQHDAQLAQLREQFSQTKSRYDYALLSLGRDCVDADFALSTTKNELQQALKLRSQIG